MFLLIYLFGVILSLVSYYFLLYHDNENTNSEGDIEVNMVVITRGVLVSLFSWMGLILTLIVWCVILYEKYEDNTFFTIKKRK